jgi:predicted phosphate transport protein (TIGR00153 family)
MRGWPVRWFLPKNDDFLRLFDQASENILAGVCMFREMLGDLSGLAEKVDRLKEIEHQGDRLTHQTLARLNTTFITPFDREDIHALITKMDDILDATDAAANRTLIYQVAEATPPLLRLSDLLVSSVRQVRTAVVALHDRRRHKDAMSACVEINRLENEADSVHRQALAGLFSGSPDPIELIKLKEIYSFMEEATDRCEDVANAVESIIIKSS